MTDAELIEKKLAFIETCVAELRRLADPSALESDVREQRFVEHTLQIAIQGLRTWPRSVGYTRNMTRRPRPVEAEARPGYRLWLRYDDGAEGEIDLSGLVGRGVFAAWQDLDVFRDVEIGELGELVWGDSIDLCPDALYLELTGKKPEELFPRLKAQSVA